jgi:hypothetical protein
MTGCVDHFHTSGPCLPHSNRQEPSCTRSRADVLCLAGVQGAGRSIQREGSVTCVPTGQTLRAAAGSSNAALAHTAFRGCGAACHLTCMNQPVPTAAAPAPAAAPLDGVSGRCVLVSNIMVALGCAGGRSPNLVTKCAPAEHAGVGPPRTMHSQKPLAWRAGGELVLGTLLGPTSGAQASMNACCAACVLLSSPRPLMHK